MKIRKSWILIAILVLAAVLRLWKLGSIPPGLTPDEAALGYNAYSILKTGKDEFGKTLPIIFKSFGDYKPGLYVYLDTPFVATFGLNEISTRLPSAVAGILIVWLIYLVCYIWFGRKAGILAALVAATNPYLIYFSRGAWEANISLMLTLAGIYFFLKALYKPKFIITSAGFFALTLLTYQGAKLSTAIVLAILILVYWKDFWKIERKYLIKSLALGLVISAPVILTLFNGQAQRLAIFSVFSYPRLASETTVYSGPLFYVFHSDALNYIRMILSRWFNFYSGQFLFFTGDGANPVHTSPYQGVLLLADLVLLPAGLFAIFRSKFTRGHFFLLLWLVLAPLSAAISRDQTNAVRSLNAAVPLAVTISFGLGLVLDWISERKIKFPFYILFIIFYVFGFVYFLDAYFVHLSPHNSQYWRYGYKQVVNYVIPLQSKYKKIIFEQSYNQPYIYFLFYEKYDPVRYQRQANLVDSEYKGDVGFETGLDNISFEKIDWSSLQFDTNVLVVSGPTLPPDAQNKPEKFKIIHKIKYLNGFFTAFKIIEVE